MGAGGGRAQRGGGAETLPQRAVRRVPDVDGAAFADGEQVRPQREQQRDAAAAAVAAAVGGVQPPPLEHRHVGAAGREGQVAHLRQRADLLAKHRPDEEQVELLAVVELAGAADGDRHEGLRPALLHRRGAAVADDADGAERLEELAHGRPQLARQRHTAGEQTLAAPSPSPLRCARAPAGLREVVRTPYNNSSQRQRLSSYARRSAAKSAQTRGAGAGSDRSPDAEQGGSPLKCSWG